MSDGRWLDVDDDVLAATTHFDQALALHAEGRFHESGLVGYRDSMALTHALQSAHTSAEAALLRVLRILGEDAPTGDDWHKRLIERLAKANGRSHARPALLSPAVAADLDETRRFRNRATGLRHVRCFADRADDGCSGPLADEFRRGSGGVQGRRRPGLTL